MAKKTYHPPIHHKNFLPLLGIAVVFIMFLVIVSALGTQQKEVMSSKAAGPACPPTLESAVAKLNALNSQLEDCVTDRSCRGSARERGIRASIDNTKACLATYLNWTPIPTGPTATPGKSECSSSIPCNPRSFCNTTNGVGTCILKCETGDGVCATSPLNGYREAPKAPGGVDRCAYKGPGYTCYQRIIPTIYATKTPVGQCSGYGQKSCGNGGTQTCTWAANGDHCELVNCGACHE